MTDKCDFCGRPSNEVGLLVEGRTGLSICSGCITASQAALASEVGPKGDPDAKALIPTYGRLPRPSEILTELDRHVIGQQEAKTAVAVAVYNHYKRRHAVTSRVNLGVEIQKSNILMLGPSGSGKTEIARAVSRILGVPFHKHDASKITQAGYVGDDVETMLQGLLGACDGNLNEAQWGIIFLDEFDKLARKSGRGATGFRDVTGEGAQQALLTMIEGGLHRVPAGFSKVASSDSVPFDTSNVLFICAGSFDGIYETVNRRLSAGGGQVGFGARERAKALTPSESYLKVEEEDILDFGIIPELAGRLPVVTSTLPLTEAEMKLILTTPANAIIKQFQALFRLGDNISLEFEDAALDAIAAKAHKSPKGARALRGILEGILRESMLTLPDCQTPGTLLVTAKAVAGEAKPEFTEEPRLAVG